MHYATAANNEQTTKHTDRLLEELVNCISCCNLYDEEEWFNGTGLWSRVHTSSLMSPHQHGFLTISVLS